MKKGFPTKYLLLFLIALVLILGLVAWPRISLALFYVTGEEQTLPQISGVAQLAFNLVRPPLQLANDVPVNHAGINPFGWNKG